MSWKEAAAELGTAGLISALRALEGTMKKRDFKRLVATTAAEVLAVHPGVKPRKARRWARKATGTRPSKSAGKKRGGSGVKEAVAAAGTAAITAGAGKVAARLADGLSDRAAVQRRVRQVREKMAPDTDSADEA
jgi:hypothetical protein